MFIDGAAMPCCSRIASSILSSRNLGETVGIVIIMVWSYLALRVVFAITARSGVSINFDRFKTANTRELFNVYSWLYQF